MARKPRDYKAEYRARNERARKAGYNSYGEARRERENNKAAAAGLTRSELRAIRKANREWSKKHSLRPDKSGYKPSPKKGATYDVAYFKAWVDPTTSARYRKQPPGEWIRNWFVNELEDIEPDEWDEDYGVPA